MKVIKMKYYEGDQYNIMKVIEMKYYEGGQNEIL